MNKLEKIIAEIKSVNESRGCNMSDDADNDQLISILSKFDLPDDADILENAFGLDGLHRIRDAEQGLY